MKRNFLEEEHIRRLFIWEDSARERWSVGLFWFSWSPTPPLSTGLDACLNTPPSSAYIWTLPHTNIHWTNIKHTEIGILVVLQTWLFTTSLASLLQSWSNNQKIERLLQPSLRNFRSNYFLYKTLLIVRYIWINLFFWWPGFTFYRLLWADKKGNNLSLFSVWGVAW